MAGPDIPYFAYGSNLDPEQMRHRCPGHEVVGPAELVDYRLAFLGRSPRWGGAVATVQPMPGGTVWGVLFRLTPDDLASLDRYEDYRDDPDSMYDRREVRVRTDSGVEMTALTYFMRPNEQGRPSRRYLDTIARGAASHGLPEDYVRALEAQPTADGA